MAENLDLIDTISASEKAVLSSGVKDEPSSVDGIVCPKLTLEIQLSSSESTGADASSTGSSHGASPSSASDSSFDRISLASTTTASSNQELSVSVQPTLTFSTSESTTTTTTSTSLLSTVPPIETGDGSHKSKNNNNGTNAARTPSSKAKADAAWGEAEEEDPAEQEWIKKQLELLDRRPKVVNVWVQLVELNRCRRLLKDTLISWKVRVKAMNRVEELIRNHQIFTLPAWTEEGPELAKCLCVQVTDLRSAIVREACHVITSMSETMQTRFEYLTPLLFHQLTKNLYVTVKIIRESSDQCAKALLLNCRAVSLVPDLIVASADPHKQVRAKAAEYLGELLHSCSKDQRWTAHKVPISRIVVKLLEDTDMETRKHARALFFAYESKWPEATSTLYSSLPHSTQKSIDKDRELKEKHSSSTSSKSVRSGIRELNEKRKKETQLEQADPEQLLPSP